MEKLCGGEGFIRAEALTRNQSGTGGEGGGWGSEGEIEVEGEGGLFVLVGEVDAFAVLAVGARELAGSEFFYYAGFIPEGEWFATFFGSGGGSGTAGVIEAEEFGGGDG